jgi:RND family efflux transporter MFP subunit
VIPVVLVIVLGLGFFVYKNVGLTPNVNLDSENNTNLSVLDSSSQDFKDGEVINLAFPKSGRVNEVSVKEGEIVKKGQILASLDGADALGALQIAKANYEKVLNGATGADIDVLKAAVKTAEINLENTKSQQALAVKTAYTNLLNSTPEANLYPTEKNNGSPIISGNYNLGKEGQIIVSIDLNASSFKTHGLLSVDGDVSTNTPQPIGNSGLFIEFPTGVTLNNTEWSIDIPNKKAPNYLANYNAYQTAVSQAKFAIDQSAAMLAIKKAAARGSDIDLANADILSAQGQVQAAQAHYNDTIISAPVDGTVTSIDIKIGEQAMIQKEAIVLQDVSNIYIETNINEANISSLSLGMPIDITYDSFGTDKIFKGTITKIDPASTVVSGVVNYKVTASTEQVKDLRPGMTANMTIKVAEKDGVIAIPSRSIITNSNGDRILRIITNTKTKSYKEVPIVTGLEGDGGLVEVLKGLSVGDEFVILIKQ